MGSVLTNAVTNDRPCETDVFKCVDDGHSLAAFTYRHSFVQGEGDLLYFRTVFIQ